MRKILLVLLCFFFGCGYKPITKISQNVLGDRVYAYTSISINDPQNSVIIQDAVKEAVVSRFGSVLSFKKDAKSILHVNIKSVNFRPIVYDKNGYITSYKAKVILGIDTTFSDGSKRHYDTYGEYDFHIQANSVISDIKRFDAIKYSSLSALDEYIAFIASSSYKSMH